MPEVNSVYLMPMSNGLDQFMANRIAAAGVFRVVADPKRADAVVTDRLGEAFEKRMDELFPPPAPQPPEADEDKTKKKEDEEPVKMFSSGRGKGNIFLVDAKTRQVLWSAYQLPKNSTPGEMNRIAGRIVGRLQKDLVKK